MKKNKLSNKLWIILGICIFTYCIYVLSKRVLTDYFVDEEACHTKAIIINEENVFPNQRGINPEFSYSYEFEVNGTKFTGNSHDSSLKVGDTIEIKFNKTLPCFNKPLHPKQ